MGFIRRRGVGMVIEGRRCDIDHIDLLLQIIEVDLGLEVPAPRPKSRLSLKWTQCMYGGTEAPYNH